MRKSQGPLSIFKQRTVLCNSSETWFGFCRCCLLNMKIWTLCKDSWVNNAEQHTFSLIETLLPGAKGSGTIKCYAEPNNIWLKTLKYIFTSVINLAWAQMSWSHAAGPEVAPFVHCGLFREIFLVVICGRSLQGRVITEVQVTRRWLLIRDVCQ